MIAARCKFVFVLAMMGTAPAAVAGQTVTGVALEPYLGPTVRLHAVMSGIDGNFLFDTGEGISSITPAFAAKIGCQPWGQISVFQMTGKRIDMARCDNVRVSVGGHAATMPTIGVFDLMSLLPKEAPEIDGSIGLDVFENSTITIDQRDGRIIFETPASLKSRIAGAVEVPVRVVRDGEGLALTLNAGVRTPKGMAWMELDTGNFGPFIVGKHLAPVLGLSVDASGEQPVTLKISGTLEASGTAEVKDLIMDGNIGERFLHNHPLTLDIKNSRAWIGVPQGSR